MSDEPEKNCGLCGLWGPNFNNYAIGMCCADAVMDLPESFRPRQAIMAANEGTRCPIWEPARSNKEEMK